MTILLSVLHTVLLIFLILLIARIIIQWVRVFSHSWRPSGVAAIGVEAVYSVTDPPLRLLHKFIPPLPLGGMRLDLGFMVLTLVVYLLLNVTA